MKIQQCVDRGLELRAQIQEMGDELSVIEERLRAAALNGEQVPLVDEEREGRMWLARGAEVAVPVVLTADLVAQSFAQGSIQHARLAGIVDGKLTQFYRPVTTWKMMAKSGVAFRREAAAILGELAGEFVTAALSRDKHNVPKSQVKVEWERAEEVK
jgi:hypothetical protein